MGEIVVIHLTPHEIDCGMCGATDNQDEVDDRKAVPFLNGEPTTSEGPNDGYKAVCPRCYQRWDAWDNRMCRRAAAGSR